jgi:uncharacterized membrane protein YesL
MCASAIGQAHRNNMKSLFSYDGKVFEIMTKITNLIIVNVLFVVCSLPIFTIGASATALYTIMLKMQKSQEGYIARDFLKAFKANFKQATIIWLILLFVGLALGADMWFANRLGEAAVEYSNETQLLLCNILSVFAKVLFVFWAVITSYIFPILAKFDNTIKRTFLNSVLMSIRHLLRSVIITVANLLLLILAFLNLKLLMMALMIYILIGFSIIAYFNSSMFNKIFDNYIPDEGSEHRDEDFMLPEDDSADNENF